MPAALNGQRRCLGAFLPKVLAGSSPRLASGAISGIRQFSVHDTVRGYITIGQLHPFLVNIETVVHHRVLIPLGQELCF